MKEELKPNVNLEPLHDRMKNLINEYLLIENQSGMEGDDLTP